MTPHPAAGEGASVTAHPRGNATGATTQDGASLVSGYLTRGCEEGLQFPNDKFSTQERPSWVGFEPETALLEDSVPEEDRSFGMSLTAGWGPSSPRKSRLNVCKNQGMGRNWTWWVEERMLDSGLGSPKHLESLIT